MKQIVAVTILIYLLMCGVALTIGSRSAFFVLIGGMLVHIPMMLVALRQERV